MDHNNNGHTKDSSRNHNHNNDAILASKIEALLKQQRPTFSSSSSSTTKNFISIHEAYWNECQVIALILLSRIQDFNLYCDIWQRHDAVHLATSFLPQLVAQQQQQALVNDNNKDDDAASEYYSLSLQTQWLHLVAQLLSRFSSGQEDSETTPKTTTRINGEENHGASSPSTVEVVNALTEIVLTALENDERLTKTRSHATSQQVHVDVIMSLSAALDIGLSSSSSSPSQSSSSSSTTKMRNVDRILSRVWAYYQEASADGGAEDASSQQVQTEERSDSPVEEYELLLQTLTAMWSTDVPSPENGDTAKSALLNVCFHILSIYGLRMANNGTTTTLTTDEQSLPSFWKLALGWWCANHLAKRPNKSDENKGSDPVNEGYRRHYLAWAELLLQIIQQPGTHDDLHRMLLDSSLRKNQSGHTDDDCSASSSCISQNLFQLLLACIASPEQAAQPLGGLTTTAATSVENYSHTSDNDPQPQSRLLRPLAWTCLTSLLQNDKIGWKWLFHMETLTSNSSSTSRGGRHLTTLVRLAVGEWKIQLGYYLAGSDTSQDAMMNASQTLIQICGQFIVQTVQFVAQLADDDAVVDNNDDSDGDKDDQQQPVLSSSSIQHLRRSLDEALDAAVQYLGLHSEQHGREPRVDTCVIRVLGSLLTEMNVFDQRQQQQRQPRPPVRQQQQNKDDDNGNENATLHALRVAMELTTKSSSKGHKASGAAEGLSLQELEGYQALMPSLAYVLASAEGDEHCVQLLKDYNVLDREILDPFLHSFWKTHPQYQQQRLETFASIVPWCSQVIELYTGLGTVVETSLFQADLIAWIRRVLRDLPTSNSSQQQGLISSLESAVSCYVTLQGETQPQEPDFSILQRALETCARCLPSEKQ